MAFRLEAIVPKGRINVASYRREIEKALMTEARQDVRLLRKPTAKWSRRSKPKFEFVIFKQRGAWIALSFPTKSCQADIWWMVERGTPPHTIVARRAQALRFYRASSSKTVPRMLRSFSRRNFGAPIYRRRVRHPGTKPRHFIETIQRERLPKFQRLMRMAMKRATQQAWA